MIGRTRARTAALAQVATPQSTLEALPLPAATFDAVVCFRVWPHFEDEERALAVVARWLRPDGRLLIVHWDGREKLNAIHASHHAVVADVFPPRAQLESALVRYGFTVTTWIDTSAEIFIAATH
ncbi:MAG: class I SAM-dependent methyltransferase [Opitutaceae bacterium]|nr:class I SAM-dependent methyltransferase [Opitutaceae bacterium]